MLNKHCKTFNKITCNLNNVNKTAETIHIQENVNNKQGREPIIKHSVQRYAK